MLDKAYLLFGLLAAILYAFSASSLKAATDRGMRSMQTALFANVAVAIAFIVFLPWGQPSLFPPEWYRPTLIGILFFLGQLFTVMGLRRGHASIATPAMGSKVVLVALSLTILFHRSLHTNVWIAAALTTIGIIVLAWPTEHFPASRIIGGVGFSILAALCYAIFDALTQVWCHEPGYSFGNLIPWAIFICAVLTTLVMLIMERKDSSDPSSSPLRRLVCVPKTARLHLTIGVGLLTLQSVTLVSSIGFFRDAAGLNVVYGSRGIWSVLIVWLFGHHFSTHERIHTRALLIRRLTAASLIAAAICLVFL